MLPDTTALALFLAATVALNLTPGPDMLYVMANSVGQGRRAGVAAAFGVGGGCIVHTFAAAFGLSALMASSPLAYEVIRFAGAAYLLYLGIRAIAGRGNSVATGMAARPGLGSVFRQGVITNVLNPKVALFFLAFLPQFVDPARGAAAWQFVLLGVIFNTSSTLVNSIVALVAGTLGNWLERRPGLSRTQRWFTGGMFLALGARMAVGGVR